MNTNSFLVLDHLPPIGARVRLKQDVDRFPDFLARAGSTGVVVTHPEHPDNSCFAVRMDEPLPGAEPWENEIWWSTDQAHFEMVPFAVTVLRDIEVLA